MPQLLVLGGGFAGVMAALNAVDENDRHGGDIAVTLVSTTRFLTIRPRLYERDPRPCHPACSFFSAWTQDYVLLDRR